jgi:hypothetical protein
MERNTIEITTHTITIADENTAIRFAVPAFEKIHHIDNTINIPSGCPKITKISVVHNKWEI